MEILPPENQLQELGIRDPAASTQKSPLREWLLVDLNLTDYRKAWDLQLRLVNARRDRTLEVDTVLFLEHPPVFTLGRRASLENQKTSKSFLESKGIPIIHVERGGDITYHGPGQLVVYPIVDLRAGGWKVVQFVEALEELMIRTLMDWGIKAERKPLNRGVWVGMSKIGSIGIAVRRSISFHGLALNVNNELEPFSWVHPCGLQGVRMTSMKEIMGEEIPMEEVHRVASRHIQEIFGVKLKQKALYHILNLPGSEISAPEGTALRVTREHDHRMPKPPWLKRPIPSGPRYQQIQKLLKKSQLHTVCQEARCPNLGECFCRGTATFLILGDHCTRTCGFCAVAHGPLGPPDPEEPAKVAEAVKSMGLRHVVVTSVTRDDLPDGGANHFAETIKAIQNTTTAKVEVLIPDFQGDLQALKTVIRAHPDVLNHNMETVPRLYPSVRPGAVYERSLRLLMRAKDLDVSIPTKSGLMLGLGETPEEIRQTLLDLLRVGCSMLTLGQYLQPSREHLPVERFISPEEFDRWRGTAIEMGFLEVASGPFVRSSYHAEELFQGLH